MFTGIIEETGVVERLELRGSSGRIRIRASKVLEETRIGDSIAVNGICLTVTDLAGNSFEADVMAETVRRSSLGSLGNHDRVNLERAMRADSRFGGHIVTGHIDGCGVIRSMKREENAIWVRIVPPEGLLRGIVEKGSIAIDGISLTVAEVDENGFAVSVIPHTGEETTLLGKKAGDPVNLETDILGKYVEKFLFSGVGHDNKGTEAASGTDGNITLEFLQENGF